MNNVKSVKSIGKRVQELRKERGWKQVDLAKRIGRPQGYVSRFEGDEFENPTKETIEMFAKALRIDPSELFANQSNLERPPGAKDAPRECPGIQSQESQ